MAGTQERFGERLRRHREAAGFSQEVLAERAGLSANAISALERGERKRPYPDTIRRLADALGLGSDERAELSASVERQPGPVTSPSPPSRQSIDPLPAEPTPLIGREREAEVVRHLLLHQGGRVLTLTGPGGVGKTRLALHVARQSRPLFPDGVAWVELGNLSEAHQVIPAIARSVGLEESLRTHPVEALRNYLEHQKCLLVLDNLEHVLDAAPAIAALVGGCPTVRILGTSRAPLNIRGEQEYIVPPLELPTPRLASNVDDLAAVPSVRLFTWHARQRDPLFRLAQDNLEAIGEICRRLEGVPLAIELAAARVKTLGVVNLLGRLDRVLPVLTGGPRDLPARQRTMEGAIRWSYDLLPSAEQSLFRRLSVFSGGWTLEAAETVIGDDLDIDIFDSMASLVDQSLVRRSGNDDQDMRFSMLEILREFGQARLEGTEELQRLRDAHLTWCVTLAEASEEGLAGPDQVEWIRRLAVEHDNIRAALGSDSPLSHESRLRLAGALWRFWWWHGHLTEGRAWLSQVLQHTYDGTPSPWRAKALVAGGILAREQGDFQLATAMLEDALEIRRTLDDAKGTAQTLNILGLVAMTEGKLEHAIRLFEDALELYRAENFPLGIANALNNLASAMRDRGQFTTAVPMYEESIAIYRQMHEKRGIAVTIHNLGRVKRDLGDLDEAIRLLSESLAVEQELGDRLNMAMTFHNMGRVAWDRGDLDQVVDLFTKSLETRLEFGDRLGCIKVIEDVAGIAVDLEPALALRLLSATEALRSSLGAPLPPADEPRVDSTRCQAMCWLDGSVAARIVESGRALEAGQVVDEALAFLRDRALKASEQDSPQS